MSDGLPVYPNGEFSIGAGPLDEVTDVSFRYSNGAKLHHTIRKSPAGVILGDVDCSGSFSYKVPEDGPEFDALTNIESGKVLQGRLKIPTANVTASIVVTSANITMRRGDGISFSCDYIGKKQ